MSGFCVYNNALLSLQFLMDLLSLLRLLLQLSPPSLSHGARLILQYRMVESSATSYCTPLTPHSQSVTINATSPLTHQLTNLLVDTRYYIKIAAATSIGSGPYSSTITALTQNIITPDSVLPSSSTIPNAVQFSQSVIPVILIVALLSHCGCGYSSNTSNHHPSCGDNVSVTSM